MPRSSDRRRRPYHHPDLRRALIDAGLDILRRQGPEALTLRAVAREVGVSQTAPYRHFTDRAALIAAVAEDGFRRLRERMMSAASSAVADRGDADQGAVAGLRQFGLEYVRFALEHPAEYRIMFGGNGLGVPGEPGFPEPLGEARQAVFTLLRNGVAGLQQRGIVRPGDPSAIALSAWALVHGLVMLTLDGQTHRVAGGSPEELALAATELLMYGMAADT